MYIFIWMIYIVHFLIQMSIKWARDAKNRLEILKEGSNSPLCQQTERGTLPTI